MKKQIAFVFTLLLAFAALSANAQTNTFTYQGRLIDNNVAAGGSYEMQFRVFDSAVGGLQQPQPTPVTLTFSIAGSNPVSVSNGAFTVQLNFGAGIFTGASRWLEISVRKPSDPPGYTLLNPRQPLTSSPYSIKAINANAADLVTSACVLCITDAQISSIDGSKVSGTVANAANATNASNAASLGGVAANQYVVTTDPRMTDGRTPIAGSANYIQNTTSPQASSNFNISGDGSIAGNLRVGPSLGYSGTIVAIGSRSNFALFGVSPNGGPGAIGGESLVPGSWAGFFNGNGYFSGLLGLGTINPAAKLHVAADAPVSSDWQTGQIRISGATNTNRRLVLGYDTATNVGVIQSGEAGVAFTTLSLNPQGGSVGIGLIGPTEKLDVAGNIRLGTGTTGCIFNRGGGVIAGTCSSDRRFKKNIAPFGSVLQRFQSLRPVYFDWRTDEFKERNFGTERSYGLLAQDVENGFPELVTTDETGYKAVNYSLLPLITIKAVKEQQQQIEVLRTLSQNRTVQIERQQAEISELRRLVCSLKPNAAICKEIKK